MGPHTLKYVSDFSPTPRLCKVLFGRASHCAYPECEEVLIEEHREQISVNVEIAHIRAEKPGGARYDPAFEGKRGDAEDNLLLLCTKHHKWVDDFEDDYPAEELLAWKAEQVAQGRRGGLTENQVEQIFLAFTTPRAEVEVVGIIRARGENVVSKIENLKSLKLLSDHMEEQLRGVRVSNVGALGFGVDGVGLEIDSTGPVRWCTCFRRNTSFTGRLGVWSRRRIASGSRTPSASAQASALKESREGMYLYDSVPLRTWGRAVERWVHGCRLYTCRSGKPTSRRSGLTTLPRSAGGRVTR